MQSFTEKADRYPAIFRIGEAIVQPDQRGPEIEFRRKSKGQAAFNGITLALGWIEFDIHSNCICNLSGYRKPQAASLNGSISPER